LMNGAEYSCKVDTPKGDPQNPMSEDELSMKFKDCARLSLPQIQIEKVLEMVSQLESLGNISELMKAITYTDGGR
jgi:2-methylcitrate dehydratase PrpD